MNPMKFFWGLVFTGIGVLLLGTNLGWWDTNVWEVLWYLWPLVIIIIGLKFLINNDSVFMVLALLIVLASGYIIIKDPNAVLQKLSSNIRQTVQTYSGNYKTSDVEKLVLRFNLGASNVVFSNLDSEISKATLYRVETKNYGNLTEKKQINSKEATVEFTEEMNDTVFLSRLNKRELSAKISTIPELNLDINSGATKFEGDFSKLQMSKFVFRSGASDIDIRFGKLVDLLEANFEMGASSVDIKVPEGVGLKVVFDSEEGLNNFNYSEELNLIKDNHTYTTEDFDNAEKKISINLSAGVSQVDISRY